MWIRLWSLKYQKTKELRRKTKVIAKTKLLELGKALIISTALVIKQYFVYFIILFIINNNTITNYILIIHELRILHHVLDVVYQSSKLPIRLPGHPVYF